MNLHASAEASLHVRISRNSVTFVTIRHQPSPRLACRPPRAPLSLLVGRALMTMDSCCFTSLCTLHTLSASRWPGTRLICRQRDAALREQAVQLLHAVGAKVADAHRVAEPLIHCLAERLREKLVAVGGEREVHLRRMRTGEAHPRPPAGLSCGRGGSSACRRAAHAAQPDS